MRRGVVGSRIITYKGIPYAAPLWGKQVKRPQPVQKWEGENCVTTTAKYPCSQNGKTGSGKRILSVRSGVFRRLPVFEYLDTCRKHRR